MLSISNSCVDTNVFLPETPIPKNTRWCVLNEGLSLTPSQKNRLKDIFLMGVAILIVSTGAILKARSIMQ